MSDGFRDAFFWNGSNTNDDDGDLLLDTCFDGMEDAATSVMPDDSRWTSPPKCTCGVHKTYGKDYLYHSDYCDLYRDPKKDNSWTPWDL